MDTNVDAPQWGLYALRHGIQNSMEAILACHSSIQKNDLTGWQNGVNCDVFAQATFTDCIFTPLELIEQCTRACEKKISSWSRICNVPEPSQSKNWPSNCISFHGDGGSSREKRLRRICVLKEDVKYYETHLLACNHIYLPNPVECISSHSGISTHM